MKLGGLNVFYNKIALSVREKTKEKEGTLSCF